jgi:hypothetical protein
MGAEDSGLPDRSRWLEKEGQMDESERGRVQREQFQGFVDDWTKLANGFISSSATLAKRLIRQQPGAEGGVDVGPLQELWMAMASAAGDMAELSYRWVQAVDGLAGFTAEQPNNTEGGSGTSSDVNAPGGNSVPGPGTMDGGTRPESESGTWEPPASPAGSGGGD